MLRYHFGYALACRIRCTLGYRLRYKLGNRVEYKTAYRLKGIPDKMPQDKCHKSDTTKCHATKTGQNAAEQECIKIVITRVTTV